MKAVTHRPGVVGEGVAGPGLPLAEDDHLLAGEGQAEARVNDALRVDQLGSQVQALALQIELTQGSIARALALDAPGLPEVSRVRIATQQAVTIGDGRGLRLAGQFDWRLAGDPIRVDSPFEIYLQRGERGQSWRLARPISTDNDGQPQEWLIDPLPLKS
jgi:hypothetical protein